MTDDTAEGGVSGGASLGGGSDARPLGEGDLVRGNHRGTPIVDDTSLEQRGEGVFCCGNCAQARAA